MASNESSVDNPVSSNPYRAPKGSQKTLTPPSVLAWTIGAVFGCCALGGVGGASVGGALGTFSPGYYRSVFSNGESPGFDPVAVGVGQGLTQGLVLGSLIGLALVAMYYWSRTRPSRS